MISDLHFNHTTHVIISIGLFFQHEKFPVQESSASVHADFITTLTIARLKEFWWPVITELMMGFQLEISYARHLFTKWTSPNNLVCARLLGSRNKLHLERILTPKTYWQVTPKSWLCNACTKPVSNTHKLGTCSRSASLPNLALAHDPSLRCRTLRKAVKSRTLRVSRKPYASHTDFGGKYGKWREIWRLAPKYNFRREIV